MNTTTNMIVKSGQTLLLGGILFQKDSKVEHKLPLLGDAPLIGGLFRHNTVNKSNSEMLVFMTPRVIDEPNSIIPEATIPREKLEKIREELGINLQGLSSKDEPDEKSVDVANEAQEQDTEPTAQVERETTKPPSHDTSSDIANRAKADKATRQVNNTKNPNVHNFDAIRQQITPGQSSTLSWSISNVDRVRIEPGIGIVGSLGSAVVKPSKTTTYTLIAKNKSGESRVTQRIEVTNLNNIQRTANLNTSVALDDRKRPGG
jgi:hypothetical protein